MAMTVPSPVPSTKRNFTPFIVPLVTLVVGAGVGYGWATRTPSGAPSSLSPAELRTCYDEATKTLTTAGVIEPDAEQRSFTGTIRSVSGNTVTLAVEQLSRNPLAEKTPEVRMVTIAADTKLTLRVMREENEYFMEQRDYQDALFAAAEGNADADLSTVIPPSPYKESVITLADVKEGMTVSVTADMDILRAEAFTALEFSVIEQPASIPAPEAVMPPGIPPVDTANPSPEI